MTKHLFFFKIRLLLLFKDAIIIRSYYITNFNILIFELRGANIHILSLCLSFYS